MDKKTRMVTVTNTKNRTPTDFTDTVGGNMISTRFLYYVIDFSNLSNFIYLLIAIFF